YQRLTGLDRRRRNVSRRPERIDANASPTRRWIGTPVNARLAFGVADCANSVPRARTSSARTPVGEPPLPASGLPPLDTGLLDTGLSVPVGGLPPLFGGLPPLVGGVPPSPESPGTVSPGGVTGC